MINDAPIGVFDSGVGGLTVAREIMRQLPEERMVYFGDTARLPYGSKSRETIIRFVRQIISFLETRQVKAIVFACNTASAYALDTIEKEIDLPIIGVVRPGARTAVKSTKNKKIGVIATEATINSGLYTEFIQDIDPRIQVYSKACPLFVPLVEEGLTHDFVTEEIARRYLSCFKEDGIDTLILGCTHYPLLRSLIGNLMGDGVCLVNPAYETAIALREMLKEQGIAARPGTVAEGHHEFFVSDGAEKFRVFANSIMPQKIPETKVINIERF